MFEYFSFHSIQFPELMATDTFGEALRESLSAFCKDCAMSGFFFLEMRLHLHSVGFKGENYSGKKTGKEMMTFYWGDCPPDPIVQVQ